MEYVCSIAYKTNQADKLAFAASRRDKKRAREGHTIALKGSVRTPPYGLLKRLHFLRSDEFVRLVFNYHRMVPPC